MADQSPARSGRSAAAAARPSIARTGPEKVAVLLLALGDEIGPKILQRFDPDEVKKIMAYAASIGDIHKTEVEAMVAEFADEFVRLAGFSGGSDQARHLLESAFPDNPDSVLNGPAPASAEPVWKSFQLGSENILTPYLLDEHPQTIAYVISNLDGDLAARVLAMLPRNLRATVTGRLLKLFPVSEDIDRLVQGCLGADLLSKADDSLERAGRSRVASVLNRMEKGDIEALLGELAAARPEDTRALKKLLFSFEDIERLDQKVRTALFDKIPTEMTIKSLRGMPPAFAELVLSALGQRARRMAESELTQGSQDVTPDVTAARRAVAETALQMAARGEISLEPQEGEGGDEAKAA